MGIIGRFPLIAFFALSYLIFWIIWIPLIPHLEKLAEFDLEFWVIALALIGIYAPTWAALIVVGSTNGRQGLRELLKPLADWRVAWRWYLYAVGVPVLLAVIAVIVHQLRPNQIDPSTVDWKTAAIVFVSSVPFALLAKLPLGPMAEELGWRGFALPRLQRKMSALNASLLLGLLWALWHLPAFWVPGAALPLDQTPSLAGVILYAVDVMGVSIIFTWIYNSTRGSLLIDFLFHAAYNALPVSLFVATDIFPESMSIYIWLFCLGLVIYYGPQKLAASKVTKE